MPRVFLSPLGFHEDILIRALIQLRASRLDRLLVVSCKPLVGGVRRAFDGLKASCSRQDLPEPGLLEVDCSRFYESIAEVRKELGKHEGELILLLGAGLRILSHMLEVAVLVSGRPFKIYYEPESEGGERVLIDHSLYENLLNRGKLSNLEQRVLKLVLEKPGVTVVELARELGVKEKTVRNTLTKLKSKGLVAKKGRNEGVEPTSIAIALYS
ncbi:CRISPR-associated CARF protein Csa3 [Desulfurococcus amylolyticus]|uniref:CRISPR-associated CARF protein Csa3 n=1 Tax=Desulfurococcus amylolyticus TaxID=94694 RepID=UPI0023F46E4C|nr:CRISPR-associated CARF protein Csa3 [Desulfurococcus amylolyticus]